jgi:hypothetical protein
VAAENPTKGDLSKVMRKALALERSAHLSGVQSHREAAEKYVADIEAIVLEMPNQVRAAGRGKSLVFMW